MKATVLALALMAAAAAPAMAQPRPAQAQPAAPAVPAPAPAATPDAPERTTAQFGDWTVQCVRPAAAARICEMALSVHDQRQQLVAVLALGRLQRTDPLRLVARVPVNVSVGQAARLVVDGGDPVPMPFRNCLGTSCFAETELRDEVLVRRLRARPADQPGRVEWRDAGGNEAGFPVSLRGFAAAFEALGREGG
jgi:invasion protein IalB